MSLRNYSILLDMDTMAKPYAVGYQNDSSPKAINGLSNDVKSVLKLVNSVSRFYAWLDTINGTKWLKGSSISRPNWSEILREPKMEFFHQHAKTKFHCKNTLIAQPQEMFIQKDMFNCGPYTCLFLFGLIHQYKRSYRSW